jgi:hypothetical protein
LLAHRPEEVLLAALGETRTPLRIAESQADELETASEEAVLAAGEVKVAADSVEAKVLAKASS